MSAVVFNVVIGLTTSVLSGGSVWAWRRAVIATAVHRKAAFFGLIPGSTCLIAMNHHCKAGSGVSAGVGFARRAGLYVEISARGRLRSCGD